MNNSLKRKICVITGSRAEYGHLYWLMKEIQNDPQLELQIIATASHLVLEFGLTYKSLEDDGFTINDFVEVTMASDSSQAICKAVGLGCIGYADSLRKLQPDMVVILGDRYEMFAAAFAAYTLRLPIAHLHGGEVTLGALDEAYRHSITKMSFLHFVSTEAHKKRVIQLGENPQRVFNFGAPGIDHCYRQKLLSRVELQEFLDFDLSGKVGIVTYHPVTLEDNSAAKQIENLLEAISQFDIKILFTKANADTNGRVINEKIKSFVNFNTAKYKLVDNLGSIKYLSCLSTFDIMIGNSSSGIIEAGSFKLPVVNIGQRQLGRTKGSNVVDAGYSVSEIASAINKAISSEFKMSLKSFNNPYDGNEAGQTSRKIKETLKNFEFNSQSLIKEFHNI